MLMSDGSIRNAYTVKLRNMKSLPRTMRVSIEGLPGAVMWTDAMDRASAARNVETEVPADATGMLRIYLIAPPDTATQDFSFSVVALEGEEERDSTQQRFTAPGN